MAIGVMRGQADDDVERTARPIGQQHEAGRHGPADDEGDGDEAKLEGADAHVAESMRSARRGTSRRRSAASEGVRKYLPGWDRRVIATCRPPTVNMPATHRTDRPVETQAGDTWDMAGQAPRGSRGHGRSSRPGSSSPAVAAASVAAPGPAPTRTTPKRRRRVRAAAHGTDGSGDTAGLSASAHEGHDPG